MKGYWYCVNCKCEVDSRNVTFEELHDSCFCPVKWIEEKNPYDIGIAVLRAIEKNKIIASFQRYSGDKFPVEIRIDEEMLERILKDE